MPTRGAGFGLFVENDSLWLNPANEEKHLCFPLLSHDNKEKMGWQLNFNELFRFLKTSGGVVLYLCCYWRSPCLKKIHLLSFSFLP